MCKGLHYSAEELSTVYEEGILTLVSRGFNIIKTLGC